MRTITYLIAVVFAFALGAILGSTAVADGTWCDVNARNLIVCPGCQNVTWQGVGGYCCSTAAPNVGYYWCDAAGTQTCVAGGTVSCPALAGGWLGTGSCTSACVMITPQQSCSYQVNTCVLAGG
jgi:hypothetical protein